jgi:hypothetical protein
MVGEARAPDRLEGKAPRSPRLADVRTFILNEPVHIQERNSWQRAAAC